LLLFLLFAGSAVHFAGAGGGSAAQQGAESSIAVVLTVTLFVIVQMQGRQYILAVLDEAVLRSKELRATLLLF
jgi:hypothetical protein